jgi:hypothetical protein
MSRPKTFGVDCIYDKQTPGDVIKSLHLDRAAINQDEYSRAEWFWKRRPKALCETLTFYFCYIAVFVCLLCLVPQNVLLFILWFVAAVIFGITDCIRVDRWRNEYKSSIKRAVVHLLER